MNELTRTDFSLIIFAYDEWQDAAIFYESDQNVNSTQVFRS